MLGIRKGNFILTPTVATSIHYSCMFSRLLAFFSFCIRVFYFRQFAIMVFLSWFFLCVFNFEHFAFPFWFVYHSTIQKTDEDPLGSKRFWILLQQLFTTKCKKKWKSGQHYERLEILEQERQEAWIHWKDNHKTQIQWEERRMQQERELGNIKCHLKKRGERAVARKSWLTTWPNGRTLINQRIISNIFRKQ